MKDMEMSISLKCSVCGNDLFSVVDETVEVLLDAPNDTLVKCLDCGREITKEQFIKETTHIIEANVEDFKADIMKEFKKDVKKAFKKWK